MAASEDVASPVSNGNEVAQQPTTVVKDTHSSSNGQIEVSAAKAKTVPKEDQQDKPEPFPDLVDGDDEKEAEEESWEQKRQKLPKVAEVNFFNSFEHFKNRYSEEEGFEIIEVLKANPNTAREVVEERSRRKGWKKRKDVDLGSGTDGEGSWIQRVRIQSAPILLLLSRLSGHGNSWTLDSPRTFFRPFRTLYYFHSQMKDCLHILEERWKEVQDLEAAGKMEEATAKREKIEDQRTSEEEAGHADDDNSSESSDDDDVSVGDITDVEPIVTGTVVDTVTALKHLQCYVKFVDEHIMTLYERFAGTTQRKVRFSELWMLFQPDEILYSPPVSDSNKSQSTAPKSEDAPMYQTAWRLYSQVYTLIDEGAVDDLEKGDRNNLYLHTYYIDYNGSSYGPVRKKFVIPHFDGEKDITSLEVYPMRFVKDAGKLQKELRAQGERFQSTVGEKHLYYEGWTLTRSPTGEVDENHKNPEHIEGDVIIDFVEGFKADPTRKPAFEGLVEMDDSDWPVTDDRLTIRHWSDSQRTKLLGQIKEKLLRNEWFGGYLEKRHRKNSKFMKAWEDGSVTKLDGDDLILLPRRLLGYALRERKFVMVDIQSLRPIQAQDNVFRDLKIDENHKRMVKSLVKSHFRKQDYQKHQPTMGLNQDLIRGKGSGLVILLHGVPGVGKTATAEAVAQANKKPLFVITCGDLGFTPSTVESALKDIFRLAHLWECVLLLDEADIFLSRRETSDLQRNALVSVFLRVLEYYSGILFLTTNRVGTLDEAFKSRIHVSLYYEPLTLDQTLAIFDVNIRKLEAMEAEKQGQLSTMGQKQPALDIDSASIMHYAEWYYNDPESQRWNGRQIRNAFQIASSLAHFDMEKTSLDNWDEDDGGLSLYEKDGTTPGSIPVLNYKQFQMVAEAIEKFDAYLYEANAGNDEDNARTQGIRADDFDPRSTPTSRGKYYPPRPAANPQTQRLRPVRRNSQQEWLRSPTRGGPPPRGTPRGPPTGQRTPNDRYRPPRQSHRPQAQNPQPAARPRGPPPTASASLRPQRGRYPGRPGPIGSRDDSGYSGWSTTPDPSLGQEEVYPSVEGGEEYDDGLDENGNEFDDEYDEEGYDASSGHPNPRGYRPDARY